jgi:transcriptional regulator of met regulon
MEAADDWPDNEEIPREKVDTALQTLNEALTKERTRRLCGRSLRTATPNAFLCPTSTSSRLPRVILV